MKKAFICLSILAAVFLAVNCASALTIDLITNGDFETGDLAGWTQTSPDPNQSLEWGVASGYNIGGEYIESSDGSYFATPWAQGPNPLSTALAQVVDLSPYISQLTSPYLSVAADLIYSDDGIAAQVTFYDSSRSSLSSTYFGEYRHTPITSANIDNGHIQSINTSLPIPYNASYVEFMGIGYRHEGTYIDSGFDNVSLKVDIAPVPEPSTVLLLGMGMVGLLGYSRKRTKKQDSEAWPYQVTVRGNPQGGHLNASSPGCLPSGPFPDLSVRTSYGHGHTLPLESSPRVKDYIP